MMCRVSGWKCPENSFDIWTSYNNTLVKLSTELQTRGVVICGWSRDSKGEIKIYREKGTFVM